MALDSWFRAQKNGLPLKSGCKERRSCINTACFLLASCPSHTATQWTNFPVLRPWPAEESTPPKKQGSAFPPLRPIQSALYWFSKASCTATPARWANSEGEQRLRPPGPSCNNHGRGCRGSDDPLEAPNIHFQNSEMEASRHVLLKGPIGGFRRPEKVSKLFVYH